MTAAAAPRGGAILAGAVRALYAEGQTDYWLEPLVLVDGGGRPLGLIQDGDAVVFCCRRGEREIQLTEAFVDPHLDRFPRKDLGDLLFVSLTLYHEKFRGMPVAFGPSSVEDTLGAVASRAGLRQVRIAESEKVAHVTYFLNGGRDAPFPGEEGVRIPSPRGIPFDRVPELSLACVAAEVVRAMEEGHDLVVANFANGDVLGHTQDREAKIACAALVDAHLGEVVGAARAHGYVTLVTADHGNLEEMVRPDGKPHVAHTANPVPFILVDARRAVPAALRDGALADVAPTVLDALGLAPPAAMTGRTLAPGYDWDGRRRVLLLVLDGWGLGKDDESNPIWLARTPAWDELLRRQPWARLAAAGEAVGLRAGKPGNSEAGHMNLGAGRVVLQDDVRLDLALRDGSFQHNEVLCRAVEAARQRNANLHLIGLLTEKSSHGSIDYPLALLRMAAARGLDRVYLHLIFDGRSTEPGSAPAMLERLERQMAGIGVGRVVSGMGRGIALDRDGDYGRTQRAYDALVSGRARPCAAIWPQGPERIEDGTG
jgi:2,3-bisphosphoglycerate-independent phosphoglycerate mutase